MQISRLLLGVASLCAFSAVSAAELDIKVQNLTHGSYFTPLIVAAHNSSTKLFSVGMPASMSLTKMAEGGSIDALDADLMAAGANIMKNPAGGLLAPGKTATTMLSTTGSNTYLSVAAMLLPTNDGFVAANAIQVPTTKGEYVYWLNAYDSGTEANDEKRGSGAVGVAGFPVPPSSGVDTMSGTGGTGMAGLTAEGFVHIHRGVLGDDNATGGKSDINNMTQRWLNPVARLVITVK